MKQDRRAAKFDTSKDPKVLRGHRLERRRKKRWSTFITVVGLLASIATSQSGLTVTIPGSSSLAVSRSRLIFDLTEEAYPPPQFPAYYFPVESQRGDPLTIDVFANVGSWIVEVSFDGLYNDLEGVTLPADRVEYSTDGGLQWFPLTSGTTILIVGAEPAAPTESHEVLFRVRIEGDELPGSYAGSLVFSLTTD